MKNSACRVAGRGVLVCGLLLAASGCQASAQFLRALAVEMEQAQAQGAGAPLPANEDPGVMMDSAAGEQAEDAVAAGAAEVAAADEGEADEGTVALEEGAAGEAATDDVETATAPEPNAVPAEVTAAVDAPVVAAADERGDAGNVTVAAGDAGDAGDVDTADVGVEGDDVGDATAAVGAVGDAGGGAGSEAPGDAVLAKVRRLPRAARAMRRPVRLRHAGGGPQPSAPEVPHVALRHPKGWFSAEMPASWSVWQSDGARMVLDTGLHRADGVDATALVALGWLEDSERGIALKDFLARHEMELANELQRGGVQMQRAEARVAVVGPDRARIEWPAVTGDGRALRVWLGVELVGDDAYLGVLGVMVEPRAGEVVPELEHLFATLRVELPAADAAVEAALVGREFYLSTNGSSAALHTVLGFGKGHRVQRTTMFSGTIGLDGVGSESEKVGRYRVLGDTVVVSLDDRLELADVVVERGRIAGLRFGNRTYLAK